MYGVECDAEPLAQGVGKLLVAVALLSSQMEITVNGLAVVVQLVEHHKECDRVGSAT